MPQLQLPMFPDGVTEITNELAFAKRDGRVTYFYGHLPVFGHDEDDIETFRMITSQFVVNGNATQAQIRDAFGVPAVTIKRYVKLYREQGARGFYAPRRRRGPAVLTPEVMAKVQQMLDAGRTTGEIAKELDLKADTLNKAANAGRLHRLGKKTPTTAS
jgi:transposase